MFFFWKKKEKKERQRRTPEAEPGSYMIMNTDSVLLARGVLESALDAPNLQMRILNGQTSDVVTAEIVQAVPDNHEGNIIMGRVILRRGNLLVLDPLRAAGSEVRQNFRMPMDFFSYAYPHGGGRNEFIAVDLSCGGIAFTSEQNFIIQDFYEIVIPVTDPDPLILEAKILRSRDNGDGRWFYAAQFQELLKEEEAMVRESVFNAQIQAMWLERAKANSSKNKK